MKYGGRPKKTWRRSAEKERLKVHTPDLGRNPEGGTRIFTLERDCEGLARPMAQRGQIMKQWNLLTFTNRRLHFD